MYKALLIFLMITFNFLIKPQGVIITSPTANQTITMPQNQATMSVQVDFDIYGYGPWSIGWIKAFLDGQEDPVYNNTEPQPPLPTHINLTLSPGQHTIQVAIYFYRNCDLFSDCVEAKQSVVSVNIANNLSVMNIFNGGNINVNSETEQSPNSFVASVNDVVEFGAIDQPYGGYDYVWNQSGVYNSEWQKKLHGNPSFVFINGGTPRNFSYTITSSDNSAIVQGALRKNYAISRSEQTEFDGTSSAGVVGHIVEQNSGSITAPSTKTVNGKSYSFSYWSDNNSRSNPRTVTPTDNTTYTAYYKAHLYSNLSTGTTTNSQRKIVQSSTGDWAMVYTSSNEVWLSRSTDGTNWDGETLISDNTQAFVYGYPSIAISGNLAYIVWQGIDWAGGSGFDLCSIFMRSYDLNSNALGSTATIESFTPNIEAFQANPVIDGAWGTSYDNKMVAWREPNGIKVKEYDDNDAWSSIGSVSGTNGYSYNPSICYYSSHPFLLCWENVQYVYDGDIKYTEASYGGYGWSFTNSYNVSPTNWESNTNPQITLVGGNKPAVVWSSRNNVAEGIPSVHVRQKISGTWQSTITSFTYSSYSSATPAPVIGDYSGNNKMDVLWNIGNTVFKASYNGSSWTGPTTITTSGGTGVSINKNTTYQTKSLWKKSDNTIAFYDVGGTAPPKMAASETNKEIILPYRLNRHAIIELSKGIDSTAEGSVCFEIAGMNTSLDSVNTKINYSENDNSMSSEPFKVAVPGMELNFRGAIYGKGLEFSNNLVSAISEPLANVVLKENGTGKVLKDIWTNGASMLNSVKDKTFGEFRESNVNLNNFLGKTVYVEVELLGKTKGVKPIIDNDYLILSDSAASENNLGKTAVVYDLPSDYKLMQNYPNPFNPSTTISFYLPKSRHVTLKIYNTLGKEIMTAANGNMEQGYHAVNLDMSNESSGIYFYTLSAGNFRDTKKLLLLK